MNKNFKRDEAFDEINGIIVPDPYRWLEDADSSDVSEWIDEKNEKVFSVLKNGLFDSFSSELVKNFKVENFSNPIPVKGKYFYTERKPEEDQGVLYVKNGLAGEPVKLFDPNGKRDGNTITIDYWTESKSGRYVAYGVSEGGDEMATLYIKDTETNVELTDHIIHCRYSSIAWLIDDSGFFYTRNARPGTVPKNEEHLHTKVYLHKLGDDPNDDQMIWGEGRPKDEMIQLSLSPDGRYLSIKVSRTWTENSIHIYDTLNNNLKTLVDDLPALFFVDFLPNKVLLQTNYKANNYRILESSYDDMYRHVDNWREFLPERDALIQKVALTKKFILVEYLVDVCSQVLVFDFDGVEVSRLPLGAYTSLSGISARVDEEEFFYGVDSFLFPKIVYRYNPVTDGYDEYRKTKNPIDPQQYVVKQEWYLSKDGTRVPMFIFHKKEIKMESNNPTILYGYGGFSHALNPGFMMSFVPWIERGGIFAIANIRGGGEFGDKWHKGGIKEKKQNSFDDFISAAEYLVDIKYTSSEHLGILGGSNGGLLVSAVAVQRPDLFRAVCSIVPLTDMVRFPKFGIAVRWTHEYGDPQVKEDLQNILKWSPYHNIKEGVEYPNIFFTTAIKDTRVDPLHARKMAARLEEVNKQNQVLIFTEKEAGHGPGKPIAKIVEAQALVLSFFAKNLNLQ